MSGNTDKLLLFIIFSAYFFVNFFKLVNCFPQMNDSCFKLVNRFC